MPTNRKTASPSKTEPRKTKASKTSASKTKSTKATTKTATKTTLTKSTPTKTTSTKTKSTKTKAVVPASRPSKTAASQSRQSKIAVRSSQVHGRGVYATRDIKKGERVVEYKGELISWKEADRRPPSDPNDPYHTFLFSFSDGKHVLDGGSGGNVARWINHSCKPNCETEEDDEAFRVYVMAKRDIKAGEELNYDYSLIAEERITKQLKLDYACRCGARNCRGTMLALPEKKKKKAA